jgi:hypothetical protein
MENLNALSIVAGIYMWNVKGMEGLGHLFILSANIPST